MRKEMRLRRTRRREGQEEEEYIGRRRGVGGEARKRTRKRRIASARTLTCLAVFVLYRVIVGNPCGGGEEAHLEESRRRRSTLEGLIMIQEGKGGGRV